MQPNRRQHRTPFTATAYGRINDADGTQIALCMTPELARWLVVAANYFDRLSAAVRVCKGEHENMNGEIQMTPAYKALVQLIDEYEQDLRGPNHTGG
jgi:hypothetical protein